MPAGMAQGDIVLAFLYNNYGMLSPPGWTTIDNSSQVNLSWIRRGASDPSGTFSGLVSAPVLGCVLAYRGCLDVGDPYTGLATNFQTDLSPFIGPSVTPHSDGCRVVDILFSLTQAPISYDAIAFGSDTGWSPSLDVILPNSDNSFAAVLSVRDIAGPNGVSQGGVTLMSGGGASRVCFAYALALLPMP